MATAEAMAEAIRPGTHERIGDRVDDERQRDRERGERRRQAQHLVVVEEQEGVEGEVLQGVRQGAERLEET